jgi:uncharacterized protein YigE (DUF2233 family)
MKRPLLIMALLLLLIPVQCTSTPKGSYTWNVIEDGFEYATYSFSISEKERSTIHAFRIDPKKYRLRVAVAADEVKGATAEEFARRDGALLVINGGFFTPEHRSIGLIVNDGKKLTPLHKTSWWSIFQIRDGAPSIVTPSGYKGGADVEMALQCGPRLTVDGAIPKFKESVSKRSAIGVTRDGKVVIMITDGYGLSMKELAKRMGESPFQGGLGCPNSMALDGGSSSQLYAKIGKLERSIEGLAKVTNGIAVFKK